MYQQEQNYEPMSRTGESEGSAFDRAKRTAADKLHQAAQALQEKSERGSNQDLSQYGQRVATWLDQTADYVGEMNPQQIKADIGKQVQNNPGRSLLIAGGIGLVLGAIFRRR